MREPRNEEGTAARVSETPSTGEPNGERGTPPADHSWEGDEDGHNCAVCAERGDTLNLCWRENHLSPLGETRVAFAKAISEQTGITNPARLLRLADAAIAGANAAMDDSGGTATPSTSMEGPEG